MLNKYSAEMPQTSTMESHPADIRCQLSQSIPDRPYRAHTIAVVFHSAATLLVRSHVPNPSAPPLRAQIIRQMCALQPEFTQLRPNQANSLHKRPNSVLVHSRGLSRHIFPPTAHPLPFQRHKHPTYSTQPYGSHPRILIIQKPPTKTATPDI